MSATPITPVTPAFLTESETASPRITNPQLLTLARVLRIVLLLFDLVVVAYLLPLDLDEASHRAEGAMTGLY